MERASSIKLPLTLTKPVHSTFSGLAGLCLRREVKGDSETVYLVRGVALSLVRRTK
jgi:hypothetical protein